MIFKVFLSPCQGLTLRYGGRLIKDLFWVYAQRMLSELTENGAHNAGNLYF